jgi:hypothetical protein
MGNIIPDTVQKINPLTDPRWERFIANHPRASIFHSTAWLGALQKTYRYEPVAYTTSPASAELTDAIVFCKVRSWLTGRRMVSLPFSDHCEPLVPNSEIFEQLLSSAQNDLKQDRGQYLELRPLPRPLLERLDGDCDEYVLHVLDLQPDLQTLHSNLHVSSIRRKITRGARENLIVKSGNSEQLLEEFYRLHLMTRRRQSLPPHPKIWFSNLLNSLEGKAVIRVATKGDVPIAAVMTAENKNSIVYKYGCSDAGFHKMGGMPFLFWDMIRDAKKRGFAQLDLGRSELSNAGLITFKDRWGAAKCQLTYWRFPSMIKDSPNGNKITLRVAKALFARSPDWVLITAGNLLYPHIG